MAKTTPLDLDGLRSAVTDGAAALRLTQRLEAISPKVFPPTYEGGKYATEERVIKHGDGQPVRVPCVLLDSVASQANRMEAVLQEAYDGGEIDLPMVSVDFEAINHPGIRKITSLQAPHRIADAILRDSTLGSGKDAPKFRSSEIGKQIDDLTTGYATPLLKYAPHCLIFGMWDSTGPKGGLGVKFARAVVSEVIGVNVEAGVKTGSRIDPLNIRVNSGVLYEAKGGGWTLDESDAVQEKKKPKKLGKDGKPSEANHGNVTPGISDGGFTIEYAEQTTVLSLPALRRLRFPSKAGERSSPERDTAARTYLAALGLLGATLAVEAGYDLRSRCLLRAADAVVWQKLGRPGEADAWFTLDRSGAIDLYRAALAALEPAGLSPHLEEVALTPEAKLLTLVTESMRIEANESVEGGD